MKKKQTKKPSKKSVALSSWLDALAKIAADLAPVPASAEGYFIDPDFRRLSVELPPQSLIDAALQEANSAHHAELTRRAERLERDYTDFVATRRKWREEVADPIRAMRGELGELSDPVGKLRTFRRNVCDDVDFLTGVLTTQGDDSAIIELTAELRPEDNAHDALNFMAKLVVYVWNNTKKYSLAKALDYVFRNAKKGNRLFAHCKMCRELLERFAIKVSSVRTRAGEIHARENHPMQKDKTPRPTTLKEDAKKSSKIESKLNRMRTRYKNFDALDKGEQYRILKREYPKLRDEDWPDDYSGC